MQDPAPEGESAQEYPAPSAAGFEGWLRDTCERVRRRLAKRVGAERQTLLRDWVQEGAMAFLVARGRGTVIPNPAGYIYKAAWNAYADDVKQAARSQEALFVYSDLSTSEWLPGMRWVDLLAEIGETPTERQAAILDALHRGETTSLGIARLLGKHYTTILEHRKNLQRRLARLVEERRQGDGAPRLTQTPDPDPRPQNPFRTPTLWETLILSSAVSPEDS